MLRVMCSPVVWIGLFLTCINALLLHLFSHLRGLVAISRCVLNARQGGRQRLRISYRSALNAAPPTPSPMVMAKLLRCASPNWKCFTYIIRCLVVGLSMVQVVAVKATVDVSGSMQVVILASAECIHIQELCFYGRERN
jgi:hypothetical protein